MKKQIALGSIAAFLSIFFIVWLLLMIRCIPVAVEDVDVPIEARYKSSGYWLYIQPIDKIATNEQDNAGQAKKGDMIDILPCCKQFIPTDTEKKQFIVIRIDDISKEQIALWTNSWVDSKDLPLAYRRYAIDVDALQLKTGLDTTKRVLSAFDAWISPKSETKLVEYNSKIKYEKIKVYAINVLNYFIQPVYAAETISTINKTGEDYNTLELWEADKDGDITAGNAEVAEVYNDDGILLTDLAITGWTTDSDSYIAIRAPVGERHSGTAGTGVVIKADGDTPIRCLEEFARFSWFEIDGDASNWCLDVYSLTNPETAGIKIFNMLVYNAGASGYGISYTSTINDVNIWDCIVYGCKRAIYGTGANANAYVYNCTAYAGGDYGMMRAKFVNCISYGFSSYDFFQLQTGSNYNFSKDDTAVGANSIQGDTDGKSPDFVNTTGGSENFHLQSSSDAVDAGTDLGTTPSGVEIDIDGRNRDTEGDTWDIGADEYVAAGDGAVKQGQIIRIQKRRR